MAATYTENNVFFLDQVEIYGLRHTFSQLFSFMPGAFGHTIDTLLGLDGLLGEDKYNYLYGPFGLVLGGPFVLLGAGLGLLFEVIIKTPSFLGYYLLDVPITWMMWNTWLMRNTYSDEVNPNLGLDHFMVRTQGWSGGLISGLLYTFPTGQALPRQIRGLFGFTLGIIPALGYFAVNRVAASLHSVAKLVVDNVNDGVRFVYAGVKSFFGYLFGKKKTASAAPTAQVDSTANREEDQPAPPAVKSNGPRIISKKAAQNEILKKDNVLKDVLDKKINLFEQLNIDVTQYLKAKAESKMPTTQNQNLADISAKDAPADEIVNKAFRKASSPWHVDRQADKTDAEKQVAAANWEALTNARNILLDRTRCDVYLSQCKKRYGLFDETRPQTPPPANDSTPLTNASEQSSESPGYGSITETQETIIHPTLIKRKQRR